MIRVLRSSFTRLTKGPLLYISIGLIVLYSVYKMKIGKIYWMYDWHQEDAVVDVVSCIPVFASVFMLWNICVEYHDGTIRNKIISGIRRSSIYMSYYVATLIYALVMYALAFVVTYILTTILHEPYGMDIFNVLIIILAGLADLFVVIAIMHVVCMLCGKMVESMFLILVLFIAGNVLLSFTMTEKMIVVDSIFFTFSEEVNQEAIESLERTNTVLTLVPGGAIEQGMCMAADTMFIINGRENSTHIQYVNNEVINVSVTGFYEDYENQIDVVKKVCNLNFVWIRILISFAEFIIINGVGMWLFSRKDIK